MTARRHCGPAGFTLLEVLVVLVVLGLLIAALAQGTSFGLLAWATQERESGSEAGLDETERTLHRLIAEADPGEAVSALQGSAHVLEFISRLPLAAKPQQTSDALFVLAVDVRKRLVLRWLPRPHAVPIGAGPVPGESVLAEGVKELDLSYSLAAPESGWTSNWTGRALPRLVRIHVAFPAKDLRRWPDIIVAPQRSAIY